MALTLNVKVGESVWFGDEKITVEKIYRPNKFDVRTPLDEVYVVTDARTQEVLPDVYLSSGNGDSMTSVKLVCQAPRDIVILRDSKYQESRHA